MDRKLKKLSPGKTNSTTSSSNESDDIILNNDEVKSNSIFETLNQSKSLKSSEVKSLKNFKSLFEDNTNQSPELKNRNNVLKLKKNLLKERLNKLNSNSSSTSKSTSKNSSNLNLSKGSSLGELIEILLNCNLGVFSKDINRNRFNVPRNQDEFVKQQSVLSKNLPSFLNNFDSLSNPNYKFRYKTSYTKNIQQNNLPLNSDFQSLNLSLKSNRFNENRLSNSFENQLNNLYLNRLNNTHDNRLNNIYDNRSNNSIDNEIYRSQLINILDNEINRNRSNYNDNEFYRNRFNNVYDNRANNLQESRFMNQNYKQRNDSFNPNNPNSVISELFILNYRLLTSMEQLTEVVEYVINIISTLLSIVNILQERTTTNLSVNEALERLPNRVAEELGKIFDKMLRKYSNEKK